MAESFGDFERRGWEDSAVCAQYDDYFSRITTRSIGALLDAVHLGDGDHVLDVATGPGYVAGAAAPRVARVVGVDFSRQQLSGLAAGIRASPSSKATPARCRSSRRASTS